MKSLKRTVTVCSTQRGLKWKHEETLEISILSQFYKTNKHSLAQFYSAVNIKLQEYIQDTPKVQRNKRT